MKRAAVAAVIGLWCACAHSQVFDGNRLLNGLRLVQEKKFDFDSAVALGYVSGVLDTFYTTRAALDLKRTYCFDLPNAPLGQHVDVVRVWLEKNPAVRHAPASTLVAVALSESYPCR